MAKISIENTNNIKMFVSYSIESSNVITSSRIDGSFLRLLNGLNSLNVLNEETLLTCGK